MKVTLRFGKYFRQIMNPPPPSRVTVTVEEASRYADHLQELRSIATSSGDRIELMLTAEKIERAIRKARKKSESESS